MRNDVRSALYDGYTEPIRDALWGHIYLTPALAALAESPPFTRLHRILQLGPAFRVYPGAAHTRASHSLGVYHLARRLIIRLAEAGAGTWLSGEGIKSFLCAALLHDLGHFPYAHSLKELPLEEHEVLTGRLIVREPVKSLVAAAGGSADFAAAIVDISRKTRDGEDSELLFYRRLLSGALDPDKLDYLSRDGNCCGVPYGAQDVDFILSRLCPHPERGVDIDSRGITAIESLLFSKYLMYRAVYWHRDVRAATAMVKKALIGALESNLVTGEELYGLDDPGLFALIERKAPLLFPLADSVRNGRLFRVAAEIPFDEKLYGKLEDLSRRSMLENRIAAELSNALGKPIAPEFLIIDLPEPVSFENNLFVSDEDCFFPESSSVFGHSLIDAFVKSLRIIRIFVDPEYWKEIKHSREAILKITEKWLQ